MLTDPDIYPSDKIIVGFLKSSSNAYKTFLKQLEICMPNSLVDWKYYTDSKIWLGKCCIKKKTLFWLSIWDGFFKVTLYFNENNIHVLDDNVKEISEKIGNVGKLIPIIFVVKEEMQLEYVLEAIKNKTSTL